MKRSLLFIVMAIGFVAAYVGGATFAPFSDETTATGDVTAGTLVFAGSGTQAITFDVADFCDELAPGESCAGTFTIVNSGNLTGFIDNHGSGEGSYELTGETITNVVDENTTDGVCLASDWAVDAQVNDVEGDALEFIGGDTQTVTVQVSLNFSAEDEPEGEDVINRCQGATATASVIVEIIQAPEPHDELDDGLNGV